MSSLSPESSRDGGRPEEIERLVAELSAAYARDLRTGRDPRREEVLSRHPELRAELTRRFRELEESAAAQETAVVADSNVEATTVVNDNIAASPGEGRKHGDEAEGPRSLGEYRVLCELGRGGMGVVYEAEHTPTGRRVALKLLSKDLPRNDDTVQRFRREARLAASLSHPNSTFVYDAGELDGDLFIAMELMPGRTLQDVVEAEGPLDVSRAVDYLVDACRGLEAAHRRGIIHRDVKPSNCFLGGDGRIKVGDFGLSKSIAAATDLTRTGAFLGSPLFAAPEQCRGDPIDERADVYGLGVTLYFLLSGRAPFTGHAAAVISQIVADSVPSLRRLNPSVPAGLSSVVSRALEKDPRRRYQDLGELRKALLPYSSQGTCIADIGLRLAAYFLDIFAIGLCSGLLTVAVAISLGLLGWSLDPKTWQAAAGAGSVAVIVAYFAIVEGVWGRGAGKRLLGLSVTDASGDPPGWRRALLRSCVLPGLPFLPGGVYRFFYDSELGPAPAAMDVVVPELIGVAGWLVGLLFLATMRKRSGFRGVHEFLSGTRVVRTRSVQAESAPRVPHALVPVVTAPSLGPYRVVGEWATSGGARIVRGRDDALERSVSIVATPLPGWRASPARIRMTRRARPFWLQGGDDGDVHWEAFEAVDGAPFSQVVRHDSVRAGSFVLQVLADLADELEACVADGSLPDHVSLAHVWVDSEGQVKLLDFPLGRDTQSNEASEPAAPRDRARRLLEHAADAVVENVELCGEAMDFLNRLRAGDDQAMDGAPAALRKLAERRHRLRWDDRLGIIAVSWGIESAALSLIAILLAWCVVIAFGAIHLPETILLAGAVVVLPAIAGYAFRGGPTFRITGIDVRTRSGGPVGRLRCAWRNLVSWAFAGLGYSVIGAGVMGIAPRIEEHGDDQAVLMLGFHAFAFFVALLVQFFGSLYAILRPRRGLQDILASTRLFPR